MCGQDVMKAMQESCHRAGYWKGYWFGVLSGLSAWLAFTIGRIL